MRRETSLLDVKDGDTRQSSGEEVSGSLCWPDQDWLGVSQAIENRRDLLSGFGG